MARAQGRQQSSALIRGIRKPHHCYLAVNQAQDLWAQLRCEAERAADEEPMLAPMLRRTFIEQATLGDALAVRLGQRLGGGDLSEGAIAELVRDAFAEEPVLTEQVGRDLQAIRDRDPTCRRYIDPFLYYKGFAALELHRVAHRLWNDGRMTLALALQSRMSERFQADIHPAARIGSGVFIDHATGVVIGETSVVGDDVSIMQSVTLGGNGKERGDRHPKIERGVLLSVGAKVLGNIRVGSDARVAAGAVVLHEVPSHTTVAGIPAKVIARSAVQEPALSMDQMFGDGI